MGTLAGIATRSAPHGPMAACDRAEITPEGGVTGDTHGRPGPRQVTVLSRDAWAKTCADLGTDLDWTLRRANLLVEGIPLAETQGRRLRVGAWVVLEITRETNPCGVMDRQHEGLQAALVPDWRGGVCCRVMEGGSVAVGDPVTMEPDG